MFITAGVVTTTLVVQGLLLRPVVRWAHLPDDGAAERERHLAQVASTEEALAALPDLAAALGTDDSVVERLRREYAEHLDLLHARGGEDLTAPTVRLDDEYTALRRAVLASKRATVIRLRDERRIDDAVLRQFQARLDIEELRLDRGYADEE